jgi:hypothetical protein
MFGRTVWFSVLSLTCLLGGLQACDSDDDEGGGATECKTVAAAGDCSSIEACCSDSGGRKCWYVVKKGGSSKTFNCDGTSCESAAKQLHMDMEPHESQVGGDRGSAEGELGSMST